MNLFTELKRRKVFRVAVVYAATAFVVLQRQGVTDLWREIGPPPDCRADGDGYVCGLENDA